MHTDKSSVKHGTNNIWVFIWIPTTRTRLLDCFSVDYLFSLEFIALDDFHLDYLSLGPFLIIKLSLIWLSQIGLASIIELGFGTFFILLDSIQLTAAALNYFPMNCLSLESLLSLRTASINLLAFEHFPLDYRVLRSKLDVQPTVFTVPPTSTQW